ncbi:26S proteasome non-ATPase regulatory subunit 7 [Artemisia annua]|uniref:26S proteasome non-ATPase regulatory subunit 7 n=1 Tax=Artemisia annua TaxID=35608 RepID=A0A2U1MNA4_ARTAN|nr:26S proteasome non-ATPase regulatory subunit 7 [Artemisia annua]
MADCMPKKARSSLAHVATNVVEMQLGLQETINGRCEVANLLNGGSGLKNSITHALPLSGKNDYLLYVPNPVLVIIDVQPKELGIPTKAYYAIEEVKENATQKSQKVFVHVPSEIAAHEVEEIGVEHLLRDVKDTTISTLATEVSFNPYFISFHV